MYNVITKEEKKNEKMITMRNDFKTRAEAMDYRDFMIARGFGAYYEEWGSFDGLFYCVRVFDKNS